MFKRLMPFLVLLVANCSFAQPHHMVGNPDTMRAKLLRLKDSLDQHTKADSPVTVETIPTPGTNYTEMSDYFSKRDRQQKRLAIIRIAIGVGLLILMVIGLARKRRKRPGDSPRS